MMLTILTKIFLTTLVSLTFYVITCQVIYGDSWHKPTGNMPRSLRFLGGLQILICVVSFFATVIWAIWSW